MTLLEVMVAMFLLTLLSIGTAAALLQSRRLTEGSVAQANAQAAVESYMEQMENMTLKNLTCPNTSGGVQLVNAQGNPSFAAGGMIPTQKTNVVASDALVWSNTGAGIPTNIPLLSNVNPGVTPTSIFPGVVDNLKEIPATPGNPGAPTTWGALWPTANNPAPPVTPAPSKNNLHMDIWVWVTDLTQPNASTDSTNKNGNAQTVYAITMIYMWQFNSPAGIQYFIGTLHSIRSPLS
jgi:hypothetical protein